MPEDFRTICEDACLIAFERIVESCLSQAVDFLLVTGRCFPDNVRSLRAEAALVRGLERLAEHGISVCLSCFDVDLHSLSWSDGSYPESVTWLDETRVDPVEIKSDGQLLATIRWASLVGDSQNRNTNRDSEPTHPTGRSRTRSSDSPFSIGVSRGERVAVCASNQCPGQTGPNDGLRAAPLEWKHGPFQYVALDSGRNRETTETGATLIHNPGAPQGLSDRELDARGCTLIDVDGAGRATATFIPVNPVRWERQSVPVDIGTQREHLLETLHQTSRRTPLDPHEQIRLMEWQVSGIGPLGRSLGNAEFQSELCEELNLDANLADNATWTHRLSRDKTPADKSPIPAAKPLVLEFAQEFSRWKSDRSGVLADCLQSSALAGGPWEQHFEALLAQVDQDMILETALDWGISRFAEEAKEA